MDGLFSVEIFLHVQNNESLQEARFSFFIISWHNFFHVKEK
jgi:hypothetical protein